MIDYILIAWASSSCDHWHSDCTKSFRFVSNRKSQWKGDVIKALLVHFYFSLVSLKVDHEINESKWLYPSHNNPFSIKSCLVWVGTFTNEGKYPMWPFAKKIGISSLALFIIYWLSCKFVHAFINIFTGHLYSILSTWETKRKYIVPHRKSHIEIYRVLYYIW